MLKRMAITSLAAAAFFSTATVVTAPFTPADAQAEHHFGVAAAAASLTRSCRRRAPATSGRRVTMS